MLRNSEVNNYIAEHHLKKKHRSNRLRLWKVYYVFKDYYERLTLESWFTKTNRS